MTRLLYWPFNTCTLGRLAIFLLVTLLAGALPAAAPADVSGFWVLSAPTGDGNVMKTFLDLKQSGGQVTGTAWIRTSKFAFSGSTGAVRVRVHRFPPQSCFAESSKVPPSNCTRKAARLCHRSSRIEAHGQDELQNRLPRPASQ